MDKERESALRKRRVRPGVRPQCHREPSPGGLRIGFDPVSAEWLETDARIVAVDDNRSELLRLQSILSGAGYPRVVITTDPRDALSLYHKLRPDLLILDLMMPGLDGFQVMGQLRPHIPPGTFFPILVLTADTTQQTRLKALASGATDFLTKPFDSAEVLLRVRNLLITRRLYLELRNQNELLETKVLERTRELEDAQYEILRRLALAAEWRDDGNREHGVRVGVLAARIAEELRLPKTDVELIRQAAPLHDIGKIAVPDRILLKPRKLNAKERTMICIHTTVGAQLLSGSRSRLLQVAEEIARTHHERWDGTGYPRGLRGEDLPLNGRIVAVADTFDAVTNNRPYSDARSWEQAAEELQRGAGTQFHPDVVSAFLRVLRRGEAVLPRSRTRGSAL